MSKVGILFEICFVTNCKIQIIEHPQDLADSCSSKLQSYHIFLTNIQLNKILHGGQNQNQKTDF